MKLILFLLGVVALVGFLGVLAIRAMIILALIGMGVAFGGSFLLFSALFGPENQALAALAALVTGSAIVAFFINEKT